MPSENLKPETVAKPESEATFAAPHGSAQFRCPKCGSGHWGTSFCTQPFEQWIGHCHGWACNFSWHRATQDKDVFVPNAKVSDALAAE